eukprot:5509093-Prymnesium_polylepis.2
MWFYGPRLSAHRRPCETDPVQRSGSRCTSHFTTRDATHTRRGLSTRRDRRQGRRQAMHSPARSPGAATQRP